MMTPKALAAAAAEIEQYLLRTYDPEALVIYGSFADGSAGEHSDFDALLIAPGPVRHDGSTVAGFVLDVFVYPPETFAGVIDPEDYVQLHDGILRLDRNGTAKALQEQVRQHIASLPLKTEEEVQQELAWCRKMAARCSRGDAEGDFRHHWVLTDSLEIYSDARQQHYFGPKKALRRMEQTDPDAFRLYSSALKSFTLDSLEQWLRYLEGCVIV